MLNVTPVPWKTVWIGGDTEAISTSQATVTVNNAEVVVHEPVEEVDVTLQ
jgi:hypothetical protein